MSDILSSFAYRFGKPTASAKLKVKPEHFQVNEELGFSFTGSGEHLMLRIRKTGENTSFVANELAKACGVKSKDVSWAGLKDRHAVTEQWFSVHLPKGEPDLAPFLQQYPHIEVIATDRHNKKLRPGDLIGNQFSVTLAEVSDIADVESRLQQILEFGVPNYFGQQRFGHDGNNLDEARRWGRDNVRTRNQNKRSLYLSVARSWIFNRIVSERLTVQSYDQCLLGDVVQDKDQRPVNIDADNIIKAVEKLASQEWKITAALAGDNQLPTIDAALALEQVHLDDEPDLMALIRGNRMRHDRRVITLRPQDLTWEVADDSITLKFSLASGSYATMLVRELVNEIAVEREY